jgi:CubicO group peptidase (beta-lactamase class C family)
MSDHRCLVFALFILGAKLYSPESMAQEWRQYVDVNEAGWSEAKLDKARAFAAGIDSAAVLVIDQGHVVAAWGDTDHPYKTASIRKSLYDATIGASHYKKPFDINASLATLGIDDIETLGENEKRATFEHLLTARSGVYHPAAYETRSNARRRPERNSAEPGTFWYYNNWDFNVSCTAFEKLSGENMETAFADRIVGPLGLEDFESRHLFRCLEPRLSQHAAITFRLSARDLARVGKLYLQKGKWQERRILSADWIESSINPHTVFEIGHHRGAGNGYGRLWWIFPSRPERGSAFQAQHRIASDGAGGQMMLLFPEIDLLIVHYADTDAGDSVSDQDGARLMNLIVQAKSGKPSADSALGPVRTQKLGKAAPKPLRTDLTAVPKERRAALEGLYMFSEKSGVRIYQHQDRLFAQPMGMPAPNDLELFSTAAGSLRTPLVDLVFEPVMGADGRVDAVRMTLRGRTQTGSRS